jgi:hypothetical protein
MAWAASTGTSCADSVGLNASLARNCTGLRTSEARWHSVDTSSCWSERELFHLGWVMLSMSKLHWLRCKHSSN